MLGQMSCQNQRRAEVAQNPIPVVYSERSSIDLFGFERLHPFDIKKYDKIYNGLVRDGFLDRSMVHQAEMLGREDLLLIHTEAYLEDLGDKRLVAGYLEAPILAKVPGVDIRRQVVEPFMIASGGTVKAGRLAVEHGAAINLGGGYHHAMPGHGEGFCLIADVPIAIRKLQAEGVVVRALIVDTDIHHGNGSVVCLGDDDSCYTFSMHERHLYPLHKPEGDRDVIVPEGVSDEAFCEVLRKELPKIFSEAKPDIVFHVAGCDALAGDPLANGGMTAAGIAKRDAMIYAYCKQHNVPYVMTLAGGYSKGAWKAQLESIKNLMR
ncbi:histone deacetylase [Rubritalea tangerina]|uniref:Histone deacetylase n=2 Tax=Rubritalea tangerina TaxID=430798 RepID=A0ABW4Z8B3_9BACT